MSTSTTLHKGEQIASVDKRWLDEYAKRGLLTNTYGAMSQGYFWGIGSIAGTMALKKLAKEHVASHPAKTPLNLVGIAILGYLVACFTQDQVTQKNRMRAERLGRRMVVDAEGQNSPSPSITVQGQAANSPVKWRKVLRPAWLGNRFAAEDYAFEKQWYHKLLSTRLKRTFFGGSQFGSFVAALTFASKKLIAYAGDDLVRGTPAEGEKGVAYHKFHTPAATAALLAVGLVALYEFEKQNTREKILDDNYIARQVARRKGGSSPITRDAIALNTGESLRGQGKEAEKMAMANRQWFGKYLSEEYKFGIFNELSKATFLGMFANFTKMMLDKAAGKEVPTHGSRTPLVFAGMMGFGSLCAYKAYHNESKLVKMSDDRLAELMKDGTPDYHGALSASSNQKQAHRTPASSNTDTGTDSANQAKPTRSTAASGKLQEYDRKWLRSFRNLSFQEALSLAIANATFFAMFTKVSNMRLDHVADKKIYFHKLRSPLVMGGMAMVGVGTAYISNTKTAMLQKLEDDRLGYRVNAPEQLPQQAKQNGEHNSVTPPSDFRNYDKKWLARYRNFAFQRGLYDAIANATFFGMLGSMSTLLLDKVGGKPMAEEFSPTRSPLAMGSLMGFGTMFAYLAQSKKASITKLHSDRLAHRVKAAENGETPRNSVRRSGIGTGEHATTSSSRGTGISAIRPIQATAPAIQSWQKRVENSRSPTPETYGLSA